MNSDTRSASRHIARLRTIAWIFDDLFRIPGTRRRLGIDALIGLLPGGGDLLGGVVSAYALIAAHQLGAPTSVMLRVALNILIDTIFGAIPLVGDLFDAGWKANRKNLEILERYVTEPLATRRSSVLVLVATMGILVLALIAIGTATVWVIRRIVSVL